MGGGSLAGTRSKEACRLPSFSGVDVAARSPASADSTTSMVLMLIVVSRYLLHLPKSGRRTRGPLPKFDEEEEVS